MIRDILKNNKGVSLIEMLVATSIFTMAMLIALGVSQAVIEGQRNSVASYSLQENLRYIFELMSREVRMAKEDDGACGMNNLVYKVDSGVFSFRNSGDECVKYFLEDDSNGVSRLKIERNGSSAFVTPDEIEINNLNFLVDDDTVKPKTLQPIVTIKMDVEAKTKELHKQNMKIQLTISSRYYE